MKLENQILTFLFFHQEMAVVDMCFFYICSFIKASESVDKVGVKQFGKLCDKVLTILKSSAVITVIRNPSASLTYNFYVIYLEAVQK